MCTHKHYVGEIYPPCHFSVFDHFNDFKSTNPYQAKLRCMVFLAALFQTAKNVMDRTMDSQKENDGMKFAQRWKTLLASNDHIQSLKFYQEVCSVSISIVINILAY